MILGADFLTKTGIDVKYSMGTLQWFENELPLWDPHTLKDKEYVAMAEISAIQQEIEFLAWIGDMVSSCVVQYSTLEYQKLFWVASNPTSIKPIM